MTQLTQSLRLNLTDTLTRNAEMLANLFQSTAAAVLQAKAQFQHAFFTHGQRFQNIAELFTQ